MEPLVLGPWVGIISSLFQLGSMCARGVDRSLCSGDGTVRRRAQSHHRLDARRSGQHCVPGGTERKQDRQSEHRSHLVDLSAKTTCGRTLSLRADRLPLTHPSACLRPSTPSARTRLMRRPLWIRTSTSTSPSQHRRTWSMALLAAANPVSPSRSVTRIPPPWPSSQVPARVTYHPILCPSTLCSVHPSTFRRGRDLLIPSDPAWRDSAGHPRCVQRHRTLVSPASVQNEIPLPLSLILQFDTLFSFTPLLAPCTRSNHDPFTPPLSSARLRLIIDREARGSSQMGRYERGQSEKGGID